MKTRFSNRLIAAGVSLTLAAASVTCVVTAVRIEYLNFLAGGAIQRKAEQEPNSKWQTGGGFLKAYKKVQDEWRREKGVLPDAELSKIEHEAIKARMRATEWSPSPDDKLGMVLKSWGLLQYPLAAMLLLASLILPAARTISGEIPNWIFYVHASIGILALGLAFYRGYFTSLGI